MAEEVRFELTIPLSGIAVFETALINHSSTPPFLDLGGVEPPTQSCHDRVLPLYHRPKISSEILSRRMTGLNRPDIHRGLRPPSAASKPLLPSPRIELGFRT